MSGLKKIFFPLALCGGRSEGAESEGENEGGPSRRGRSRGGDPKKPRKKKTCVHKNTNVPVFLWRLGLMILRRAISIIWAIYLGCARCHFIEI